MSEHPSTPGPSKAPLLSLDAWAVAAALILVLLVRLNLIHRVPW